MSHEFSIENISIEPTVEEVSYTEIHLDGSEVLKTERINVYPMGYFVGFADGVMYLAFNHFECYAGVSGNNSSFEISKSEAKDGLEKAIFLFDHMRYPDSHRMDDIKRFYREMKNYSESDIYRIRFF